MTIVLTASLAVGVLLLAIGVVFAVAHPEADISRFLVIRIAEQNRSAKTLLYVLVLAALLPIAVVFIPRWLDRIASGSNEWALGSLAAMVPMGLGVAVLFTRVSGGLPWGDGLWVLAAACGVWLGLTVLALRLAAAGRLPDGLRRLLARQRVLAGGATVVVLAAVLSVTKGSSLHPLPLVLGAVAIAAVVLASGRLSLPTIRSRPAVGGVELTFALVLVLAIVPAVVISTSVGPPNLFVPPGIVQYHHDWLLGPTNQLLREGGALMVNVPISQYGVGPVYLLDAVFHVLPIGYSTYGLLDGVLTALFYIAGYSVLRAAGVRRLLAASAMVVGVVALVYSLRYPIGQLPQQGPLRFGLPMAVVLGLTAAARWPARASLGRMVALVAVGISAVWAVETFAYTVLTLAAVLAVEAVAMPARERKRWLLRQALLALGACFAAQVVLNVWTLAATGQLPDWGEYGTYIREFVLGGQASSYTYGFEPWSPVLAVACGTLIATIAFLVLLRRVPALLARERPAMLALAGLIAFQVVLLSYSDNRSSTYLIAYVSLPLLMIAVIGFSLLLRNRSTSLPLRRGALGATAAIAVMLIATAWPVIGHNFSRSLLAHAYPGGGFGGSIRALGHPPPVDPRAPEGQVLVNRFLPGRRVVILMPLYPDLATEILIRDKRAYYFFTGDPKADSYVPAIWTRKVTNQIAALPSGTRVLMDASALQFLATIRTQPNHDVIKHPLALGDPEMEWVLQHLERRFTFQPIYGGADGFVVVKLVAR